MSKIKIILFDIDGVLIRLPYYFSKKLKEKGYVNAEENLNPFFHSAEFYQCLEGKADAKKTIEPYLKRFCWEKSASDYFYQQFRFESQYLDQSMISMIQRFKKNGIRCLLSTDQEKYRSKFLLDKMDFQNIFDGYFISNHIGFRKFQHEFWEYVITKLKKENPNVRPWEIVFFDDKKINIDIALKFGLNAFLFTNTEQFTKNIALLDSNLCYEQ